MLLSRGTRTRELTGSWLGLPGRRLWVERGGQGPAVVFTGARMAVLAEVDHNVPVRAGRAFTDLLAGFLDQLNHPHWRRLL